MTFQGWKGLFLVISIFLLTDLHASTSPFHYASFAFPRTLKNYPFMVRKTSLKVCWHLTLIDIQFQNLLWICFFGKRFDKHDWISLVSIVLSSKEDVFFLNDQLWGMLNRCFLFHQDFLLSHLSKEQLLLCFIIWSIYERRDFRFLFQLSSFQISKSNNEQVPASFLWLGHAFVPLDHIGEQALLWSHQSFPKNWHLLVTKMKTPWKKSFNISS